MIGIAQRGGIINGLISCIVMLAMPAIGSPLGSKTLTELPTSTWQHEVVYQIYPRSFADANGDGIGDLQGILSKVDYLHHLGVDMIWLCPVNKTTNYDNGYDISDYLDIDPSFGTLDDWQKLRDALHQRGIKIMMDLVLNHTSDAHPWFVQETRLKSLQHALPKEPPANWPGDANHFRHTMQALLTNQAILQETPEETRKNLELQQQPYASIHHTIQEFVQASATTEGNGYPTTQEQLARLAKRLYGQPHEQNLTSDTADDYYIWRPNPNNWTAIFSGSAWHTIETTGLYYLALFSLHQPDLNWNNPHLRQTMYKMIHTWVQRGVDGFRLDSIGFLGKDQHFPDAPEQDQARMGRGMQYYINLPQVHDYLGEMHASVFNNKPLRTVGEVSFQPAEVALEYAGFKRHEISEVFLFEHMYVDIQQDKWNSIPLRLTALKHVLSRQQALIHGRAWIANYFENHDQLRIVSRFGNDKQYRVESAKMLATLLLTLEGTPYIYQGQEIGMTNSVFNNIAEVDDIEARNYYHVAVQMGEDPNLVMQKVAARTRDNVRTVMQWDDSLYAGFSQHKPWIQVNQNHTSINVQNDLKNPQSILAYYRQMIALRKQHDVFIHGKYTEYLPGNEHVYAYKRVLNGKTALILLSFSQDNQEVDLPLSKIVAKKPVLLMSNYQEAPATHDPITLRPYEARIYTNFH